MKIHISIGALNAEESLKLVQDYQDIYLVHYDPQMFTEKHSRIEKHVEAVSDYSGFASLSGKGTAAFLENKADGDICVVDINTILSKYEDIDMLRLNCEGSEIPILLNADIALLLRCRKIYVEFHLFARYLNITENEISKCLHRLSPYFKVKCLNKHHPIYTFAKGGYENFACGSASRR